MKIVFSARYYLLVSLGINQIRDVRVQGIFASLRVLNQQPNSLQVCLRGCEVSVILAQRPCGKVVPFPPGSVLSPRFAAFEAKSELILFLNRLARAKLLH